MSIQDDIRMSLWIEWQRVSTGVNGKGESRAGMGERGQDRAALALRRYTINIRNEGVPSYYSMIKMIFIYFVIGIKFIVTLNNCVVFTTFVKVST